MRDASSFVAFMLMVAAVAGLIAVTATRAGSTVKIHDDLPSRYAIGGGLSTLPIAY